MTRMSRQRRYRPAFDTIDALPSEEAALLAVVSHTVLAGHSTATLAMRSEAFLRFFAEHGPMLGVEVEAPDFGSAPRDRVEELDAVITTLAEAAAPASTLIDRQIAWLTATLDLAPLDSSILALFARGEAYLTWREFFGVFGGSHRLKAPLLAALLGVSADTIELRLQPGGALIGAGLIVDERDGDFHASRFIKQLVRCASDDAPLLSSRMLPPAPPASVRWEDFAHLGTLRDIAAAGISAASGAEDSRFNLLLHGVPGTGKSEFARAVANQLGRTAVFAGLTDEDGAEPTRQDRLAHLAVLRALTRRGRDHVIVVDEADDVLTLSGDERSRKSKLWLNRLVEEPSAPTIWIVNHPGDLGDTIVRRMTLAIGFKLPPCVVRQRVLERHAAAVGLELSADELAPTAALPAAPAVLANAVAATQFAGGDGTTLHSAAQSILDALGTRMAPMMPLPAAYDPTLSHADRDLAALADQLAASSERGWSLLLGGSSGTGKSAFARHLADRLGIALDERRGSDLLSPFVGGTEANIAAAFRESSETGALLLIDEADTFLFDRRDAQRCWETSMVNEMLRWMEAARSPFVATTNLTDRLDPATQRRFTLRATFRALTSEHAATLFARWFGQPLPRGTQPLDAQTPGDFAVVAKRAALLGTTDAPTLLAWLREEATSRGEMPGRAGFHKPIRPAPGLRHSGSAANDRQAARLL